MFMKRMSQLKCFVDAVSHRVNLLAAVCLCLCLCHAASAYETWTDPETGIEWNYTRKNGGASLYGSLSDSVTAVPSGYTGVLTVPPTVNGLPVTGIGYYAFYGCSSLTEIILPEGVTSIGYGAFRSCSKLQRMIIPYTVETMGDEAFAYCSALSSFQFDGPMPTGLSSSGSNLFYACNKLATSQVSGIMVSEAEFSWSGVSRWQGKYVRTYLPLNAYSVGRGGDDVVYGVVRNGSLRIYGTGRMQDWAETSETPAWSGVKSSITNIVIEQGVTCIGCKAFADFEELVSATTGDGVSAIGDQAFRGCTSLRQVKLSPGLQKICFQAFAGCTQLERISLPRGLAYIERSAFARCRGLKSIEWYEGLANVGAWAFSECEELTNAAFPDGLLSIESNAFQGCEKLSKVSIPSSTRSVDAAFSDCGNIRDVTVPAHFRIRDLFPRADGLITNAIVVGEGGILDGMFELCASLEQVDIRSSVTNVGPAAFGGCSSLREIVLPDGVRSIDAYAFSKCSGLSSVSLPPSVTNIGEYAFYQCAALSRINIPSAIGQIRGGAFKGCSSLGDGVVIVDGWVLAVNGTGNWKVTLDDDIRIADGALSHSDAIRDLTLPSSMTVLTANVIANCSGLHYLTLPASLTRIEAGAFAGTPSLTRVTSLSKDAAINLSWFSNHEYLLSVEVPYGTPITGSLPKSANLVYAIHCKISGVDDEYYYDGQKHLFQYDVESEVDRSELNIGWQKRNFGGTSVGKYQMKLEADHFTNSGGLPYSIEFTVPEDDNITMLTILRRPVEVVTASLSKSYDGAPLEDPSITVGGMGFVVDECEATVSGLQTDVGSCTNAIVLKWTGNGKASNYAITRSEGTLTVTARPVSVTTRSASKVYDGTPLKSAVEVGGSGFVSGECTATATGSQTAVGASKNTLALNWTGNGKASNYSITTTEGTLTVLPAKVSKDGTEPGTGSVPAGGVSKFDGAPVKYDGKGHTLDVAKLLAVTLVADTPRFSYALSSNGVYSATPPCLTNAGTHSVWYKISAANYDDYIHEARVTILPREVTLSSGSASKQYDGKELACHTFSVGGEGFVGDDGVVMDYKGSQLWTGSSANTFTYVFKSNTRTENYDITCENGTLTVTAPNTVTIPVGTTDVPANAFSGATNIMRVRIPATVKSVAASAFSGCTAIRSVELGNAAFLTRFDRTKLTQIVFLDSVTSIPDGAASGCTADVRVTFPSTMRIRRADLLRMGFVEGVIDNFTATGDFIILNKVLLKYIGDRNARALTIPDNVEIIDDEVFRELFKLTAVDLPDTVEIIGESAFEGCDALPSFTFPAALTNIGSRAFYECMEISAVEIDSPLESIGDEAFGGCWKLATLRLPATLTALGRDAFLDAGTDNLKGVTLPTHVAPLSTFLPSSYANIEEFTGASDETSVRDDMFSGCAALKSVTFAGSETSIGDSAFADCSALTEIRIPDTVARIGRRAFAGCTALKLITMPSVLTELNDQVFADCASLTYVRLFTSVTNLGASVFSKSAVERVYLTGDMAPSANADLYTGSKEDLVTVVRAGSTGWRKAGSASFPVGNVWMSRTIQHDTSVIAVTFDANEGTFDGFGAAYSTEQTTGTAYVIPAERPVRKGYRFDGWYTARTGGSQVTELTTVLAKAAQTLYARWTPSKTITVTFVPQEGGRMPDGISSVEFETGSTFGADFERHKPTRHGWAFVGWFTAPDAGAGVQVTAASSVPEVDTTLYAHWEVAKYTVVFDKNDGTGTRYPQGLVYNVWTNLVANSFIWRDHVFLGWSYTPGYDGTIDFADAQRIDWNLAQDDGVTVVLYAQWSGDSYTVWYNANGGTGSMTGQTHLYGGTLPLKANLFAREGYDFAGWSLTGGDSAQVELRDCESVSETKINPKRDNDVELYAVWIPKTLSRVTVTFDLGTGGTLVGESATRQYRVGDTYASGGSADAFPAATRTGYTLTGWWTAATGGARIDETTVVSKTVTTLYAQWQPIVYTVRFDANGGIEKMSDQAFTYDQQQTLRKNAFTRSGYAFAGWSPTNSSTVVYADGQAVLNLTTVPNGLVTLVAQWKKVASATTYAIAFFANGQSYPVNDPSWSPTESLPNKVYKLPSCTATPPAGRTRFAGWACSNGRRYDDGCLVFNLAAPGEIVTMTAIWE